jgi:hypothetical protein
LKFFTAAAMRVSACAWVASSLTLLLRSIMMPSGAAKDGIVLQNFTIKIDPTIRIDPMHRGAL